MSFARFVRAMLGMGFTCLMIAHAGLAADETPIPDQIEFNRDVRPILSDNCFFCHGPDKNKREADLRLDSQLGLNGTAHGSSRAILKAGEPDQSELMVRVRSTDPDQIMPPASSGKSLSPKDILILEKWIHQGGAYEGHWAFLPIKRSASTSDTTSGGSVNMIDRYVRDGLKSMQMTPATEADRITLIRRLSFDLIGLPPTAEQVESFLKDTAPDAYERVVDRLLDSPQYGERIAVWWLDLVRYADSVGYHGDQDVSVSPFRQYVIESFNANKPFDQFTIEQLAGDLLPDHTLEQRIASGYNRLGMMSAEGGVQDKEYLAKYIAERVRNATGTWLGITLGCAECHDHKYDPFSTRDFYRFEAFFADIEERGLYSGASSDGNWGRTITVPTVEQASALRDVDQRIAALQSVLNQTTAELEVDQREWEQAQPVWKRLSPTGMQSKEGATLDRKDDDSILVSGPNPATDTYELIFKNLSGSVTAFRLELLPDDSLPAKGPGRASNGNLVLTEFVVEQKSSDGNWIPVELQNATASYEQTGAAEGNPYGKWSVSAAIDGDTKGAKWGWAILEKVGQPHQAIFETKTDLPLTADQEIRVVLKQNLDGSNHTIGRFRVTSTSSARPVAVDARTPAPIRAILETVIDQRTETQLLELAKYYRSIAPRLDPQRKQLAALEAERKEVDGRIPRTLVTATVNPRMIRVLRRGNWMDNEGEVVTAAFPVVLSAEQPSGTSLNRLDLARWIVSADNPLTARVFVNRIWKLLFGAGLSRRVDDLGAQGEWPSHPQLLDQLAIQFIDSGWDVKQLLKAIVLSETYRQSSSVTREERDRDPFNRWLARQGRFRLDAEFVRDNALAVSGLLVTTIGGKSVKPYQPPGYWMHLNFPMREWQNDAGENLYRRGIYTHWQRQYLHPSLLAFDAPSREECTADRPRSNTPLQSLVLLNDPTYVEAARAFAELIIRQGGSNSADRIQHAFRRALSRPASADEIHVLTELAKHHLEQYQADPTATQEILAVGTKSLPSDLNAAELAAWTSVTRTILNLHETITRN